MANRYASSALAAVMTLALAGVAQAAGTKAKEPSAAQAAARERMSKCSLEWKEAKAGGYPDTLVAAVLSHPMRPTDLR